MERLARLILMDARTVLGGGRFLVFALLALIPSLVTFYVAGLFWVPQSWQNIKLVEIAGQGTNAYNVLLPEYINSIKGLVELVLGFWAGFPILIMTSIVVSDFVSGERGSGTFDLLATKPVRRYELVVSKTIVFLTASLIVLFIVHILNTLVVALSFFSGLGTRYVLKGLIEGLEYTGYYTIVSWLFVFASTGLSLFFSVWTKRSFLPVMAVIGYYIMLGITSTMVQGIVGGNVGKIIDETLRNADFSYHARIILYKLVTGSLITLEKTGVNPNYTVSLTVITVLPIIFIIGTLVAIEKIDLK